MYKVFTVEFFGSKRVLVDWYGELAKRNMNELFDTRDEIDEWTRNKGAFADKDRAISFVSKHGKKDDEYFFCERIQ
jgi:hypothetical protein